jgi:osmotically inducible lipoprotein OsmB
LEIPTTAYLIFEEIPMKRFTVTAASVVLAVSALSACSSTPTNAQIGTGVGAVAGGVLGDAVFGSTLGTIGGAAAGAYFGNKVGDNMDGNRRR